MSAGATPIDPDESILRRIKINPGYYDPKKAPPVEAGAFRPHPRDEDGLSFYLERHLSVAAFIAASDLPADQFVIVRLRAGDLYDLGLSLVPKQEPGDLPGHVIAPEINVGTYHDPIQKKIVKELCRKLARLANSGVVHGPDQAHPRPLS